MYFVLQDVAIALYSLSESQQTYTGYLGDSLRIILAIRHCPVNKMTLCVTSDPELEKCIKMRVEYYHFISVLNIFKNFNTEHYSFVIQDNFHL